jgi:hypothetical protein
MFPVIVLQNYRMSEEGTENKRGERPSCRYVSVDRNSKGMYTSNNSQWEVCRGWDSERQPPSIPQPGQLLTSAQTLLPLQNINIYTVKTNYYIF